ncbi:MAG TPA: arsenate reductase ArsC [Candidatus Acidoferrales bacterium]|nr:arsenate reductase ArsC [Candidatus Acidoferrales bacterium]
MIILFLCTHNAAQSQMAEGFVNARFSERFEAFSAGIAPTKVDPCVVTVMAEAGIDISRQRSKSLSAFHSTSFDYVATLCDDAANAVFPSRMIHLHHSFDNPSSASGSERDPCASFRYLRDQIREWIEATFGHSAGLPVFAYKRAIES